MDILHPADLKSLITQQGKWSVALYVPTHRVGREQLPEDGDLAAILRYGMPPP